MKLSEQISQDIAAAMKAHGPGPPLRAADGEGGVDERRGREGARARRGGGAAGPRVADQAAARLDRAVRATAGRRISSTRRRPRSPCSRSTRRPRPAPRSSSRRSPRRWRRPARPAPKDMGRVMKAVMSALAGKSVDGKVVNELVGKSSRADAQTFSRGLRLIILKGNAQASHPSSMGPPSQDGGLFRLHP